MSLYTQVCRTLRLNRLYLANLAYQEGERRDSWFLLFQWVELGGTLDEAEWLK
jgi:hypothetical protein